ncbi:ubiquinone biosynthesis protein COQ7-domain-containing protein [Endogone sp. FLAS-F59071]|nr:ubiquinone biosynthesis protein COQ7-domain-containing protein [Endogone sp. FLAS-F59071]|eukprot:RUS21140.1 ubiquinone biosynthesis protein COQ7-domain-containing protein [Endogone sp. FLAS-F59071]
MATIDVLKTLVSRVARAFYEPKYIVILDALNKTGANSNGLEILGFFLPPSCAIEGCRKSKGIRRISLFSNIFLRNARTRSVKDEELALSIKITIREIHKICGKLKEDRLLKMVTKMEPRKADQRAVPKTYYYIDYKQFVDVVKWKMYKMQTSVRANLRTESENKGYICPTCQRTYSPLDVLSFADSVDGLFHCEVCETVLEENDNAENVKGSQEQLSRLREQSQPIIALLKQTDTLVIPASLGPNITGTTPGAAPGQKATGGSGNDRTEIAFAQDTGAGQGEIIVDLQMDNEAAKKAKQEEADRKRQQNAMPIWHQRSTVSHIEEIAAPTAGITGEDDAEEERFEMGEGDEADADREEFYANYYSNLTKMIQEGGGEVLPATTEEDEDEFESVGEDVDGNPGNGKRSRRDDNGVRKRAKVDGDAEEAEGELLDDADVDYPLVKIGDQMISLDEVTEDHQQLMSTEEYQQINMNSWLILVLTNSFVHTGVLRTVQEVRISMPWLRGLGKRMGWLVIAKPLDPGTCRWGVPETLNVPETLKHCSFATMALRAKISPALSIATRSLTTATNATSASSGPSSRPLTLAEKSLVARMIRVDQAGEIGANWIYRGQLAVLSHDRTVAPVIQEMWDQEKKHLSKFDELVAQHRVRPTLLRPLWEVAGFALGAGTALMGREAAMACTEAVETVIGNHYDDQLRELVKMESGEDIKELSKVVSQFRDEELEHHDIAVGYDARQAPLHGPLSIIISQGCKAAIWVATRI